MQSMPVPSPRITAFAKPFFFFTNNQKSEIVYISPSVQDVLGYQPMDLIGRCYTDLLDPQCPFNQNVEQCRKDRFEANGENSRMDLRVIYDSQGRRRVVSTQTYGEKDATGRVVFNHGIAQDVTHSFLIDEDMQRRYRQLHQIDKKLSQRERDVLIRVMDGRLNKSIARELSVSERTIESARSRLMDKFGAETTAHLIRLATEYRMLGQMFRVVANPQEPIAENHAVRGPNFDMMSVLSRDPMNVTN